MISPTTYAPCSGKHRQTYIVFHTFSGTGAPLALFKLDLGKAFDRLDRKALITQLEARIGPGAELQCWKGLLWTTRGCLQTPWVSSTVEMNRGIKQGSIESPSFFGHVTEIVLAISVETQVWKSQPKVLEGMDAEEMLFVGDGLWSRSCGCGSFSKAWHGLQSSASTLDS